MSKPQPSLVESIINRFFAEGGNSTSATLAREIRLANAAPELLARCKQMLAFIEMGMAHQGAMSVEQILSGLERVKGTAYVQTGHHIGCSKTTRAVDLAAAREIIAKAEGAI